MHCGSNLWGVTPTVTRLPLHLLNLLLYSDPLKAKEGDRWSENNGFKMEALLEPITSASDADLEACRKEVALAISTIRRSRKDDKGVVAI